MHRVSEFRTNSYIKDYFISDTLIRSDHCKYPLSLEDLAKEYSHLEGLKVLFKPLLIVSLKEDNVVECNDTLKIA